MGTKSAHELLKEFTMIRNRHMFFERDRDTLDLILLVPQLADRVEEHFCLLGYRVVSKKNTEINSEAALRLSFGYVPRPEPYYEALSELSEAWVVQALGSGH